VRAHYAAHCTGSNAQLNARRALTAELTGASIRGQLRPELTRQLAGEQFRRELMRQLLVSKKWGIHRGKWLTKWRRAILAPFGRVQCVV